MDSEKTILKSKKDKAQGFQDEIFRKMSAGKKIKLANDFFNFSRTLIQLNLQNGARRIIVKAGKNS